MGLDLIRDATVGQILNYVSNGRLLPYADQRPDYVVPARFLLTDARDVGLNSLPSENEEKRNSPESSGVLTPMEADRRLPGITNAVADPFLVDWEENDPDNPRNWSFRKRCFTAGNISLLTFAVYIGSAIYTSSIPGLMEEFNSSLVMGTLGLTLFILGYGIGPMFLSPIQDLPSVGRNPGYVGAFSIYLILQVPLVTAKNLNTVLAMRFLTGFFGSPALSTGGASMGDIFPPTQVPYVLGIWTLAATVGPILGPVIGGFSAQAKGWRWPILELIWLSGFTLIFLAVFLPETNGPTILLRRAKRLRKLTGNNELYTAAERAAQMKTATELTYEALVMPLILAMEPVLIFINIYSGFVYAVFYLWFEAFPIVFLGVYHFNEGVGGLPYLGFLVSSSAALGFYFLYQIYLIGPRYARAAAENKAVPPEILLEIGLLPAFFIPTSVMMFGFTAKASIHWAVPVVGAALYMPGLFLVFQAIWGYIVVSYPGNEASVMASNTLFRASIASVFPLFGRPFFINLGLRGASGLLAGVSFFLIFVYWLLMRYAPILRERSKYAIKD
ncbi:major facilitator superfamily domain-containing protein [Roridomyces roridus]|uniref:Major facilitator superfamily domain-containing protein n=1 Tax=Roridomyces roridus TaxID=1738132 RepID=A0AAD7CMV8_9AGAR|nr:major facilitator superfamily domain-containing protein [Roridomyces roridus]